MFGKAGPTVRFAARGAGKPAATVRFAERLLARPGSIVRSLARPPRAASPTAPFDVGNLREGNGGVRRPAAGSRLLCCWSAKLRALEMIWLAADGKERGVRGSGQPEFERSVAK
ncbi:MAG TPA: hypothetical protein VF173_12685 [Thermoanaerobaculia bacterium]|nr:hypothetical protein [Thermoanaerobaculia bacterium]